MEAMEQSWQQDRKIVTNIELLPGCPFHNEAIRIGTEEWPVVGEKYSLWDYAPDLFQDAFIVIDEADVDFDCAEQKLEQAAKIFLKYARKDGIDIVFILQSLENLNVRLRRLIQRYWFCDHTWRSAPVCQYLGRLIGDERARKLTI